jgi:glutaredoxin
MEKMNKQFIALAALALACSLASADNTVCVVYFSGIGCPHCAKTDPVVLGKLPVEYNGSLVIIEYEIYQHQDNNHLAGKYLQKYGVKQGIPQIVLGANNSIVGDTPILDTFPALVDNLREHGNPCPLLEGDKTFEELDLNTLPASPQVWVKDRILIKTGSGNADDSLLKRLVDSKSVLSEDGVSEAEPMSVTLSDGKIDFGRAAKAGGWILLWNGGEEAKEAHKVTGRGVGYYFSKLYYIVLALGVVFLVYIAYYEKKAKSAPKQQ